MRKHNLTTTTSSSLSLTPCTGVAGATGAVSQLRSRLKGAVSYGKLSGATAVNVSAGGVVSLTAGLAAGATASATYRASNNLGDAVEKTLVLTGAVPVVTGMTAVSAARFLAQSSLSSRPTEIAAVQSVGLAPWIEAQLAAPRATTFWDTMVADGFSAAMFIFRQTGFDSAVLKTAYQTTETLRFRVGMALSNFLVIGLDGTPIRYQGFNQAHHFDIIWNNAFGNFRTIMGLISRERAMAHWLTFNGSKKANGAGSQADENYARELMQLFCLGLPTLNDDGSTTPNGQGGVVENYTQADVADLAKIFTGYSFDAAEVTGGNPQPIRDPLTFTEGDYDLGAKTILGLTLPAYVSGSITSYAAGQLDAALDRIFNHVSMPAFIAGHMIRNLVTSNPSPAYMSRVSAAFINNGSGVRGDMKAVIRAVLLDTEARNDASAAASNTFGKLIEPWLRHVQMSRTLGVTSPNGTWDFSDDYGRLVQKPGRSPSVFNFFKAGYTPPVSAIQGAGLIAPEFGLVSQTNVANYVNHIQIAMQIGFKFYRTPTDYPSNPAINSTSYKLTFADALAQESNTDTLLAWLNLHLAQNRLPAPAIASIKTGVDSYTVGFGGSSDGVPYTLTLPETRTVAACIAIMTSPFYLGAA